MLNDIIAVLASELRVDEASVAWLARKLQDAELLPADDGEFLPLHAARLLVALLAAARPIDAAAAVSAYEHTSATVASDVPGNFVAALARLIESAPTNPLAPLPAQIRARRSLGEPLGVLFDVPTQRGGSRRTITLVYGGAGAGDRPMRGDVLEVYGAAPGTVLRHLADLLGRTGDAGPARERDSAATPCQAHRHWPLATAAGTPALRPQAIEGR